MTKNHFIIKIYQYLLSPLLGNRCRFLPSCSSILLKHLKLRFNKRNKIRVKKILKCHPIKKLGGSHGLDFVPIPKDKKEAIMDRNVFVAIALQCLFCFSGVLFSKLQKKLLNNKQIKSRAKE